MSYFAVADLIFDLRKLARDFGVLTECRFQVGADELAHGGQRLLATQFSAKTVLQLKLLVTQDAIPDRGDA